MTTRGAGTNRRMKVLGLLLAVAWLAPSAARGAIPATERAALDALFASTNGSGWQASGGWGGAAGSECQWYGVTCDAGENNVIGLDLTSNRLAGPLPGQIADLTSLQQLALGDNQLTGSIPTQLGSLGSLRSLSLATNSLNGSIPTQLGSLSLLQDLQLDNNSLTGSIPVQLGLLGNLRQLSLFSNTLTGSIPIELGNLGSLQVLYLGNNGLTGSIPTQLGNLAALQTLYLDRNGLTGTIPDQLGNLANLRVISLNTNGLTGSIPTQLGNLALLQELDVSFNPGLTGSIPVELGNLLSLTGLGLAGCNFTGSIPAALGNLTALQRLYVWGNPNLAGTIPPQLGSCTSLQEFLFSSCRIGGSIPTTLGNLLALQRLEGYSNQLTGTIPAELGLCTSLLTLDLQNNGLTGSIPTQLGNLASLESLYLGNNNLTGSIPTQLGNLASLRILSLEQNGLDGTIPSTLGGLPQLLTLALGNNALTGSIPTQLGNLATLQELRLDNNALGGGIPGSLGSLPNLLVLNLGLNSLTGSIPTQLGNLASLRMLDLGANNLTGSIPTQLGNLASLRELYLPYNAFTGPIPKEIGALGLLTNLRLEFNALTGPLPAELGQLVSLQELQLWGNKLVGLLPSQLIGMQALAADRLDLRWNGLYTNDAALRAFLNSKQIGGDFEATQTVPPTNVVATGTTQTRIDLAWIPIRYTADAGGYNIYVKRPLDPGFTLNATVFGKGIASGSAIGLVPAQRYHVVLRAFTPNHGNNPNTIDSDPSIEVIASTASCFGLLPAVLPGGFVGDAYAQTISATGGTPPYTFTVSGGALPAGVSLSSSGTVGVLSGALATSGTYAFTIRAEDAAACAGSQDYVVLIRRNGNHVVGQGLGQPNENRVRVYTAAGVATPVNFLAYAAGRWGVNVTGGDVDGTDPEIVTGPGPGDVFGPQVRGFRRDGTSMGKINFYAYGTLKYGVNVGAGHVDGDVYEEILTGAGPGGVFGPHVRGWNYDNTAIAAIAKINFFAYGTLKFGANVATGAVDGDLYAEMLTGPGPGAMFGPIVRGFNFDGTATTAIGKINFSAFAPAQYGVNVDAADVEADGFAEIVAAPGPGPSASFPSQFKGFDFDGNAILAKAGYDVVAFTTWYGGRVGLGDVTRDARAELLAGAGRDVAADSTVKRYTWSGTALVPLAPSFLPFGTATYGVNVAGADLGY